MAWDMPWEVLQIWRAGTVIRDDGLEDSIVSVLEELLPQLILVGLRADGWAAFMAGVALGDLFRGEGQVVRTCLSGDVDALGAGLTEEGNRFHGGEMDNVQREVGGQVREREDLLDGVGFEGGGS